MKNEFFFQINVTDEQVDFAKKLVEFSMENHKIPNIWDGTNHEKKTIDLRFTGSLGEVLFADAYQLQRPFRSFGADDGQDLGKDFELEIGGKTKSFDIKAMRRKSNNFYSDYVLNIPSSQLNRPNSLTDYYFHINIHANETGFIASFVGFVEKNEIKNNQIGKFYAAGSHRTRGDGTKFPFYTDTYEIDLIDLKTPPITDFIRKMDGFLEKKIKVFSR